MEERAETSNRMIMASDSEKAPFQQKREGNEAMSMVMTEGRPF